MVIECYAANPGFYSMNLLMTGKTYMRMKQNDQAIDYLTKTRDYPVRKEDDKKVQWVSCLLYTHLSLCACGTVTIKSRFDFPF